MVHRLNCKLSSFQLGTKRSQILTWKWLWCEVEVGNCIMSYVICWFIIFHRINMQKCNHCFPIQYGELHVFVQTTLGFHTHSVWSLYSKFLKSSILRDRHELFLMDLFYALPADKAKTLHLWLQNNHNFEVLQMVDEKKMSGEQAVQNMSWYLASRKNTVVHNIQTQNTWRGEG